MAGVLVLIQISLFRTVGCTEGADNAAALRALRHAVRRRPLPLERESMAAPGAFAGTAAVRCDVAAPAITGQGP